MKTLAPASLAFFLLTLAACGGKSSAPASSGPLTGNWQLNLVQSYPLPVTPLDVSGFVVESNNALAGSVQVPAVGSLNHCGGVSTLTGTITGQTVTFSVDEGGTLVNFTGTLGADGTSMTGSYQAVGGACFAGTSTTGTFSTFLVPALNGNFTGTLADSSYMTLLSGVTPPTPIAVSGTIIQSDNAEASNATLTGTLTAVNYPCFSTATLTGTISGQNVYLSLFDYTGKQIGTIGVPSGSAGQPGSPATVVADSTGLSLVDSNTDGLFLGVFTGTGTSGPCPPISNGSTNQTFDGATVSLMF